MNARLLTVATLLAATACSGSSAPPAPTPVASPVLPPAPSPSAAEPSPSPVPSPSPSPSPAVAGPARCTTDHLRLSVQEGDSGAGQAHQSVVLTNRGPACSLSGYPGVSFVDQAGRTLGSPADHSPGQIGRVLLATGGTATAVLTYSNAGAYPDSSCRPQQADRLRVYPPGDRVPLLVADPVLVCSIPGAKQVHIGPVGA